MNNRSVYPPNNTVVNSSEYRKWTKVANKDDSLIRIAGVLPGREERFGVNLALLVHQTERRVDAADIDADCELLHPNPFFMRGTVGQS